MKKLLIIFFLFPLLVSGQLLGNQTKRLFITTQYGHTKWGLYKLPDNTAAKYPVIVFMHGVGEAGSTESSLQKLLVHGTPWLLSQGGTLDAINPHTGQLVKFISLAIQNPIWSAEIVDIMFILRNDAILKNRIDWRGVFVTGLSAGGQNCMNSLLTSQGITDSIRAIAPMSSAGANWANIVWARDKPVWAFHGLADQVAPYQNTERFADSVPGTKWTKAPHGHGPWNPYYTPTYREQVTGIQMNLYEWFASKLPSGAVGIGPDPQPTGTVRPELRVSAKRIWLKVSKGTTLSAFSATGQQVHRTILHTGVNFISAENWAAGLYILKTNLKTYKINLY